MTKFGYFVLLYFVLFELPVCYNISQTPQFVEHDIMCLNETQNQLDPDLLTWSFENSSHGFICDFDGVECWHIDDGRVMSIKLPGMGLSGGFPSALKYCGRMTILDLSGNSLSGQIPRDLCKWLPFLVKLNLSSNQFTGSIPAELASCSYLNALYLNDNELSGSIPWELTRLERLNNINFANNNLTGPIPSKWASNSIQLFHGNLALCGKPLSRGCGEPKSPNSLGTVVVSALVLNGIAIVTCSILCTRSWISKQASRGSSLQPFKQPADHLKARRSKKVCLFEKPIKNMRLGDLLDATHNFSEDNIIWSCSAGVFYKAELPDGSLLAVNRLRTCEQSEKGFKCEMKTLGHLRHRNLVPLLGYCISDNQERLLVYKYMARGTLLNWFQGLHRDQNELDWATKLRICIGISRGLAWLHHICNPPVIHRNISSGVVYVDEDYEPRISGFGLERFTSDAGEICISICPEQNMGKKFQYDAPEQCRNIRSPGTLKGDVYSFGVVVFEVISGLKAGDAVPDKESGKQLPLIEWIRRGSAQAERAVEKYVEERCFLSGEEKSAVEELMEVGFRCVRYNPEERPSMYEAYETLTKIGKKYGVTDEEEMHLAYASRSIYT
ncbi:hypothetical protein SUGI_0285930 [Cryptomeria japonica]|uniref:probable inactive receptor kinase At1g27190 n=1 Tax=Cryptomeria japonica TaxID=3369 RepID=UPI002408B695|nr:probable inactive receptor kinase At1g27190 [Cryptomeria japonica]GLJ16659.1 hypothetical protein SUGI_0285930 [Cryptomeria japonica]